MVVPLLIYTGAFRRAAAVSWLAAGCYTKGCPPVESHRLIDRVVEGLYVRSTVRVPSCVGSPRPDLQLIPNHHIKLVPLSAIPRRGGSAACARAQIA